MSANSANFIPVVDLFAGAGGLGEGFNACKDERDRWPFRTVLSIEQNPQACRTLELRAFFWQLKRNDESLPSEEYCESTKSQKHLDRLFEIEKYSKFAEAAKKEVWETTLDPNSYGEVKEQIQKALSRSESDKWVLVGGPPCQAFSLAGRSRLEYGKGISGQDRRPSLYKVYLEILNDEELQPTIFLMENVDSLISAKLESDDDIAAGDASAEEETAAVFVMPRIIEDFQDQNYALRSVSSPPETDKFRRFVVKSERHGIPQRRHRVIIMGVHSSFSEEAAPDLLKPCKRTPRTEDALKNLPRIESKVTGQPAMTSDQWSQMIQGFHNDEWWLKPSHLHLEGEQVEEFERLQRDTISKLKGLDSLRNENNGLPNNCFHETWDHPLDHDSRRHMVDDLRRYLFASYYARLNDGASPHLHDFPRELFPKWSRIRIDSPKKSCRFRFKRKKLRYEITFIDPSNGWPKWATATTNTKQVRLFLTHKGQDDGLPKFSGGPDDGFPVRRGTLVLKVKRKQTSDVDRPVSIHLLRPDKEKTQVLTTRSTQCKIELVDAEHQHFIFENPSNGWPRWAGAAMSDVRLRLTYEPDDASGQQSSEETFELAGAKLIVEVEMDNKINRKDLLEVTLINLDNLTHFSDAFVVQPPNKPAFTITCHAGKDGHKSIHHEPWQCRSLTVREVARIQTFPDNYLFFGSATQKYTQVGNAVPPELARQLAEVVSDTLGT